MDFVAIDLGASSTRYMAPDRKVNWLPNNIYRIDDMSANINNDRLDDVIENNLDVSIWKDGASDYFPVRILMGEMATRFGTANVTPSVQEKKTVQQVNYVGAIVATAVSKLKNKEISDKLNLFIALPPFEVIEGRENFKAGLVGKYTVTFHKIGNIGGTTVEFSIMNVSCHEESRLAVLQYITTLENAEKQAKMLGSNILSIDIGASTTDVVIFAKGKYMNITGVTYKFGGNLVRSEIINKVSQKFGIEISNRDSEKCLAEGRLAMGADFFEDIGDIIDAAKAKVANNIIARMDEYFANSGMTLQSMNYIIVSGGGSMGSSYVGDDGEKVETSEPMSKYITDALKGKCKYIEVLYFGDEPRLANIRGLGSIAIRKNGEIVEE